MLSTLRCLAHGARRADVLQESRVVDGLKVGKPPAKRRQFYSVRQNGKYLIQTDSSAIERTVGWGASVDIETGLQRTLDFYRRHPWYLSST